MGEEEKKPEEAKKPEEEKVEKKEEPAKDEKPINGEKEENKNEDSKEAPPPPPPPQEIILRVYMHCEGCARKVRRCLKDFDGVEDVITDYKTSRVVVKGEKADPIKVLERVQRKSHRQVELLSPIPPSPPPAADKPKKPEEKEEVQTEEKKEPPVITVALRVYMHCEACAQETRKRIQRMKGVESAEPDLKNSEVTVKGAFEPEKLIDYVYKRMGKKAVIMKVEPEKKEEEKEEKKPAEEGKKEAKKGEEGGKGNEEGGGEASGGGGEGEEPPAKQEAEPDEPKMELKKNEFNQYYPQNYQVYPQRIVQDMYSYPPQIFSDENPNACSIM